jgi:hypothetical protein
MIAAGLIAYEDDDGIIRKLAQPSRRFAEHYRGRVFRNGDDFDEGTHFTRTYSRSSRFCSLTAHLGRRHDGFAAPKGEPTASASHRSCARLAGCRFAQGVCLRYGISLREG